MVGIVFTVFLEIATDFIPPMEIVLFPNDDIDLVVLILVHAVDGFIKVTDLLEHKIGFLPQGIFGRISADQHLAQLSVI